MNEYVMEQNRNWYGDWVLCTFGEKIDHPYLKREALGYSYELGQEITICYVKQKPDGLNDLPEIRETRSYTLCGSESQRRY